MTVGPARGRSSCAAALGLVVPLLAACASEPPPPADDELPPPRVFTDVRHVGGSPLAGAPGGELPPGAERPEDALQVTATFLGMEQLPEDELEPLGSWRRLAVTWTGGLDGGALLPAEHLLRGTRVGLLPGGADAFLAHLEGGALGRAGRFRDLRGALPRGVTVHFEAACDLVTPGSLEPMRERCSVQVHRRPGVADGAEGALEVAVDVEVAAPAQGGTGGACTSWTRERELVLLDPLPAGTTSHLALLLPCPFRVEHVRAVAVVLSVGPPPHRGEGTFAAHRDALAQCAADLARERVLDAQRAAAASDALPDAPPGLDVALGALDEPRERRGALYAVASLSGARVTEDVALSSDEALLARVAGGVRAAVSAAGALPADAAARSAALGWLVERTTLAVLHDVASRDDVPPGVAALLIRHAGGLAGRPAALLEVLDVATSLAELHDQLVEENRALLADASPAVRARAFEWLAAQGRAPGDYDPLGPADARHAALVAAEQEDGPQ